MGPTTIALFSVAALASLSMAWVIGAGSGGATPFVLAFGLGYGLETAIGM